MTPLSVHHVLHSMGQVEVMEQPYVIQHFDETSQINMEQQDKLIRKVKFRMTLSH